MGLSEIDYQARFEQKFDKRTFGEPLRALRSVNIVDNGEPLVDLREAYPDMVIKPGCLPFLRTTVAEMAYKVHQSLLPDYRLIIRSCLRTLEMQQSTQDRIKADLVEKHPAWSKPTLHRMLNRMIAPPGDKSPPPHTTGGALDVWIHDSRNQELDFNSPGTDWWSYAPTYSPGLSETARNNRLLLIQAMEVTGLTNYVGEWWHWSYGDQGWALRTGSLTAPYGSVTLENAESLRVPELPKEETPS